jgi:hypothetical protein
MGMTHGPTLGQQAGAQARAQGRRPRGTGGQGKRRRTPPHPDGGEVVTESSIRYDDIYVRQNGRWLIATRISHFTINDKRDCHRQRHGGRTDVRAVRAR